MVTWLSRLRTPRGASLRSRSKSFPHPAFVHFGLLDKKTIDIDALSILSVRYRRTDRLGDDTRRTLRNKLQNVQRILDTLAADLVNDQADFPRRDSDKFCDRA